MTTNGSISRDVEAELLNKRPKRRGMHNGSTQESNEDIYPVQFSDEFHVYDNWNLIFLMGVSRSVSMYIFDPPPKRVLDIGCGNGMWIVEAAKGWSETRFVGFDVSPRWPNLSCPELGLSDIASRVTWVQGDILEPLPFKNEEFDYVKIFHMALAIPEDQWQYVFEECSRILSPGGVIEVLEEDLIFPYEPIKEDASNSSSPARSYGESTPSLTYTSIPSSTKGSEQKLTPSPLSASTPSNSMDSIHTATDRSIPSSSKSSPRSRDHSKLARAWDDMLQRRFLSPNLISVLPFYLSTYFHDIQMMPAVHILLPPLIEAPKDGDEDGNGRPPDSPSVAELFLDLNVHGTRWSTERGEMSSTRGKTSRAATVSTWAPIHLAKTVHQIHSCKAAIWEEFRRSKGYDKTIDEDENLLREDFEAMFDNWEREMKARMSMRACIEKTLAWVEAGDGTPVEASVWKARCAEMALSDRASNDLLLENYCRSMRGYTGWKTKSS